MAVPPKRKRVGTVRTGSWPTWAYGERQHESRARTAGVAGRTRGRISVRQSARSSACSWDHSLGWAPRPKTKVKGKKFCAGEFFFWRALTFAWGGRFWGLGRGRGLRRRQRAAARKEHEVE